MTALAKVTVLLAALGAGSSTGGTQTIPPASQPSAATAAAPETEEIAMAKKAFERLFTTNEAGKTRIVMPAPPSSPVVQIPAAPAPDRRIECPIKVFKADPGIDPKIVIRTPENTDSFAIRRLPTPCK